MGGRGAYYQKGGFSVQEYEATGELIQGIKVIVHKTDDHASLPQMSNTPGTIYILKNSQGYKSMGIYGPDRRIRKEIDLNITRNSHGHKNRFRDGHIEYLSRKVAHIHHWRGGRLNNVHYLTKKDIKKYGSIITQLGGKLYE